MKTLSMLFLFMSFFTVTTVQAQEAKNGAGIILGVNYSDVNYGGEFLSQFLPKDDYLSLSSGGDSDYGFDIGLNYQFAISDKFSTRVGMMYSVLKYQIEGNVSQRDPSVTRPPSPDIPIEAEGVVSYSFLNIPLTLDYSFNQNPNKGLFVFASANAMLRLNTKWNLDVTYEDMSEGTEDDMSGIIEPDYNALWFVGLGAGYHIPLSDQISLTPSFSMKYGLNPLVDGGLEPTLINLDVTFYRWF